MSTALITGATAGLGRGFAEALAAEGHDLVLVARDRARLRQASNDLYNRYGVTAEVLSADLSSASARRRVLARMQAGPIDVLVNNAGFGVNEPFVGGDLKAERALLDVMVTAPMEFCHAALPGMVDRRTGTVVNVSSIASWATEGTYSAAKAWLRTFTEGLGAELSGTGVTVTAVCPGAVRTEFFDRSEIDMKLPGFMWMDVERVVKQSLADARKGRLISVPGAQYQAISTAAQYSPRPLVRFITAHRTDFLR